MDNLKKKSKIKLKNMLYTLKFILKNSKFHFGKIFYILLFSMSIICYLGTVSFAANETPPILQKLFDYADAYYDIDNTNNTDIFSDNLKSVLAHIHYNKTTYKTYYEQFANEEKYNDINTCFLNYPSNGIVYITFGYTPNNSSVDNYSERYWNGSFYIPLYHYNCNERIRIQYNTITNIYEVVEYTNNPGSATIAGITNNTYTYNYWNRCLVFYNDNNYYCSNPNFNGYASYYNGNSVMRLNGTADFSFFNLNLNNINKIEENEGTINFGEVIAGSAYRNKQRVYLYNDTYNEIMDNNIELLQIGDIYNGRYRYQVVTEDLSGINANNEYRLIFSTDQALLASFTSNKFKIYIENNQPMQELPGIIILSGDYNGVGSGDGFNNAINDINNNLGVIGGFINNLNNDLTDDSDVDNGINKYTQMSSGELAEELGYQTVDNSYGNFIFNLFSDLCNVLTEDSNRVLVLGFHDSEHIVLNSEEFVLPEGNPFQPFISGFVTFFYIYIIYDEVRRILDKLEEGNVLYVLDTGDAIGYSYSRFF